ncbi:MAG TPA: DUF1345 domain-containing protein [Candidatus Saccharimonadales bacterium]|nr:DUF1345 domain-containing protein [Candidatus Saccharimonadales bacterium]
MPKQQTRYITSRLRLLVSIGFGLAAGLSFAFVGLAKYGLLAAWDAAALTYAASVFLGVRSFDSETTKTHALRENPGRVASDGILLVASLASLFAVGVLIAQSAHAAPLERTVAIALGLVSVVVSWSNVHTTFMLEYARQYYGEPEGGISFGHAPSYADFAYLAFTVGMTFQVSDTAITHRSIRSTVLKHALLSYVFGTAIIAATINFLAGLSK